MSSLVELVQQVSQGVVENSDRTRYVVGVMTAAGVRCGDKLVLEASGMTQTARERRLKSGDRVLCLLDSGGCVIVDRMA